MLESSKKHFVNVLSKLEEHEQNLWMYSKKFASSLDRA